MNWLFASTFLLAASAPACLAQPTHASPSLVKESKVGEAGKSTWLALVFRIDADWHIYWDGHNDTGMPPAVRASLPEGWTLGPIQWPTPTRHPSEGDIVDYIYENEVSLLLPVNIPPNAPVGEVHEISIDLNWLACSNVCVPEKASVKTSLRVGPAGASQPAPAAVERFAAARASQPVKTRFITDRSVGNDACEAALVDGQLIVTAPSADRLVFMPASSGAPLANAFSEGEAKGNTLKATLADSDAKAVIGIVQIWKGKTQENYWIDIPLKPPESNPPAPKIVEPRTPPQIP